jgi:hypothetical protein
METEIVHAGKIAALETKVAHMEALLTDINGKMDELLDFKSKGQGAFWLGSAVFGTGLLAVLMPLVNWFRGG